MFLFTNFIISCFWTPVITCVTLRPTSVRKLRREFPVPHAHRFPQSLPPPQTSLLPTAFEPILAHLLTFSPRALPAGPRRCSGYSSFGIKIFYPFCLKPKPNKTLLDRRVPLSPLPCDPASLPTPGSVENSLPHPHTATALATGLAFTCYNRVSAPAPFTSDTCIHLNSTTPVASQLVPLPLVRSSSSSSFKTDLARHSLPENLQRLPTVGIRVFTQPPFTKCPPRARHCNSGQTKLKDTNRVPALMELLVEHPR